MKTASLLALTILPVTTAFSQMPAPALPPKSSISLKEATSEIPAPTPAKGKSCKMAHHLTTVTPTIVVGADAEGPVTWKLYAGVKSPKDKGLTLVSAKTFNLGSPTEAAPAVADEGEWECSCCRPLNKTFPKLVGWYGELTDSTGKVLATAKSGPGGGLEMSRYAENKQEFPGTTGNLQFKSGDAPQGQPATTTAAVTSAHFALASKSKFDGALKMKGPSNRSFYVDPNPILVRADYESIGTARPVGSSKTYAVNVHLSPSGVAKFKAVTIPADGIVVVVQGDQLLADELSFYDDRKSISIKGRLSSDEFDQLANTLRAVQRSTTSSTSAGSKIDLSERQNKGTAWVPGQTLKIALKAGGAISLTMTSLGEKDVAYTWSYQDSAGTSSNGTGQNENGFGRIRVGEYSINWSRGAKPDKSWVFLSPELVSVDGVELPPATGKPVAVGTL